MDELNKRFEGFGKDPSPAVWERIEQELDGHKNPVGGWYYFIAACVLFTVGISYFASLENESNLPNITITEKPSNKIKEYNKNVDDQLTSEKLSDSIEDNIPNTSTQKTELISNEKPNQKVVITKKTKKITQEFSDKSITNNNSIEASNQGENNPQQASKSNNSTNVDSTLTDSEVTQDSENGEDINDNTIAIISNDKGEDQINSNNEISTSSHEESEANSSLELALSDMNFLEPKAIGPIQNETKLPFKNTKLIVPEFASVNNWKYTASYYQGLSSNSVQIVDNYAVTLPEIVTSNIQNVEVTTTYTNERPIWVNITIGKNIGSRTEVLGGLEYGELKSFLVQSDLMVNKNTNKSLGMLTGVNYKLKNKGKLHVSIGTNLIVAQSKDNWVRNLPDPTPAATVNQYAPVTFAADETFDINIAPSLRVPEIENEILTTVTSEINAIFGIHLNENYNVDLRPFAKQSLSKKFAGSSAFSLPLQYGLGVGIGF